MKKVGMTLISIGLGLLLSAPAENAFAVGGITGAVTFSGNPPKNPHVPVAKNVDYCGKEIEQPLLLVNSQNKGVQFTVVYLEGVEGGTASKTVLRMGAPERKCDFVEHVSAVQKGSDLELKNQDPVLHNPHPFSPKGATVFNVAMTEQGQTATKKIRTEGVMRIQCDSHVHMNGWVLSIPNAYFAVTDASGNYKIDNVPPGKYELVAWHESWKVTNAEVMEEAVKKAEADLKSGKITDMKDAQLERPAFGEPTVITKDIEVKDGGAEKVSFELK